LRQGRLFVLKVFMIDVRYPIRPVSLSLMEIGQHSNDGDGKPVTNPLQRDVSCVEDLY